MSSDETCVMAGKNVVKVIESAGRKKHKTTSDNSWDFITLFWTGNTASTNGPTVYLVKSKGKNDAVPQAVATKNDNEEEDSNGNNNEEEGSSVVGTTGIPLEWGHGFDPRLHAPMIIVQMILITFNILWQRLHGIMKEYWGW